MSLICRALAPTFLVLLLPTCLRAGTVLRLATTEWPPWSTTTRPDQGTAVQIVRRICATANLECKVEFLPWARALRETERGRYDGVFPAYDSRRRRERFLISRPYLVSPIYFLGNAAAPATWTADSIRHIHIGVVRGYANTETIDNDPRLHLDKAVDDLQNLRKLAAGRVTMIVIDRGTGAWLLQQHPALQPPGFHWLEPPLEEKTLHILFHRSRKDLARQFDEAVRRAYESGKLRQWTSELDLPFPLPPKERMK